MAITHTKDGGGEEFFKKYKEKMNDPLWYDQNIALTPSNPDYASNYPRNIRDGTPIIDNRMKTTMADYTQTYDPWAKDPGAVNNQRQGIQAPGLPDWDKYLQQNSGGVNVQGGNYNTQPLDYSYLNTQYKQNVSAPDHKSVAEAYGNLPTDIKGLEDLFKGAVNTKYESKDKAQSMLLNEMNKSASQRALEREMFEKQSAANRIMTGSSRGMTEATNMLQARDAEQAHQAAMMEQLIEQKNIKGEHGAELAKASVDAEQLSADRKTVLGKAEQEQLASLIEKYGAELGFEAMNYQNWMQGNTQKNTDLNAQALQKMQSTSNENVAKIGAASDLSRAELESATNRYLGDANFKLQNYATEMGLGSNEFNTLGTVLAQGISALPKAEQQAFYKNIMGIILP